MNYSDSINELFESQLDTWLLAKNNYLELKTVKERRVEFENCIIRLQYNPKRIKSTAANIDKEEISKRSCFLCSNSRPKEQQMIDYKGKYDILINPFPIMPIHLTIAHKGHINQSIEYFPDMLSLAFDLQEYSILYNGAECGASAPDHMHFQAGTKDFIQSELEIDKIIQSGDCIDILPNEIVYGSYNYLRKCIVIKSSDKNAIINTFNLILKRKAEYSDIHKDAKLNIISRYDEGIWTVILFLRKAHRSHHYYLKNNILISPGVIDMGGVIICPREADYLNITKEEIKEIFSEVSL